MKLFSSIAVALLLTVAVFACQRSDADARRQFAANFNSADSTLRYSTEAYEGRVLRIVQSDGDRQTGRDLLTYLNGVDELRAQGFIRVDYEAGDIEIWLNVSTGTKGCEPWWVREILA